MIKYSYLPSMRMILPGLLFVAFLSNILLAGCQNARIISKHLIKIPNDQSIEPASLPIRLYGVQFIAHGNIVRLKMFGIHPVSESMIDNSRIKFTEGLEYEVNSNTLEYKGILRNHGYLTTKEFQADYEKRQPVVMESPYKILPQKLGSQLFTIAQNSRNDMS